MMVWFWAISLLAAYVWAEYIDDKKRLRRPADAGDVILVAIVILFAIAYHHG